MRIAHVSIGALPEVFSDRGGAIQRRVGALAREQTRRGHEVMVVSPGAEIGPCELDGIQIRRIHARLPGPASRLEYQLRAVRILARSPPSDVVHFHSEPEASLLSRSLGARRILSYDYFRFRRGRRSVWAPLSRRGLLNFDVLCPCSDFCADASAHYWSLERSAMEVVYNGVDLARFRPDGASGEEERRRLGISGPVVLYLGRVCRQKGTHTLLEAFSHVRENTPRALLVIVGPIGQFDRPPTRVEREWQARIAQAGAIYLGVVPDARVVRLLNMADVFVMPTAELEMFGMAAVEALACGTPVIATDHGGLRETVPRECGDRVPVEDPRALARGISRLLNSSETRAACAAAATRHAVQFGWDRIADRLEHLYSGTGGRGGS